jgi:hypothetical protein
MDPDFDTVIQWILCCGGRCDLLRKLECLAPHKRHACEVVVANIFKTVCSCSVVSTVSQGDQRGLFRLASDVISVTETGSIQLLPLFETYCLAVQSKLVTNLLL